MMGNLVLIGVLAATVLVMASGVWVACALIAAVWRVDRRVERVPASNPTQTVRDTSKNIG